MHISFLHVASLSASLRTSIPVPATAGLTTNDQMRGCSAEKQESRFIKTPLIPTRTVLFFPNLFFGHHLVAVFIVQP